MDSLETMESPEMSERFDPGMESMIQGYYNYRCTFCLNKLVVEGSECIYILDASEDEVTNSAEFNIARHQYQRQSLKNGIILCPNCHQLFSNNYITLCPHREVLKYLVMYVKNTPAEKRMPLYQVFNELSSTSRSQGLPDPSAILPYIGLYALLPLKPTELQDIVVGTPFFPKLSILRDGRWENAPNPTDSTAPNAAYIFHPRNSRQHPSLGLIPLHIAHPQHPYKRYWRLETSPCWILSTVIKRLMMIPYPDKDSELRMARNLYGYLLITSLPMKDVGSEHNGEYQECGGGGERGCKRRIGNTCTRSSTKQRR